jgi:hypothetical protein
MHFMHSDFKGKPKPRHRIEFEVDSGRYYILILVVFVLLFQPNRILIPGVTLVAILWTCDRRWVLSVNGQELRTVSQIMWITYDGETISRPEMIDIILETLPAGGKGGSYTRASLRLKGGKDRLIFAYPSASRVMELVQQIANPLKLNVSRDIATV